MAFGSVLIGCRKTCVINRELDAVQTGGFEREGGCDEDAEGGVAETVDVVTGAPSGPSANASPRRSQRPHRLPPSALVQVNSTDAPIRYTVSQTAVPSAPPAQWRCPTRGAEEPRHL